MIRFFKAFCKTNLNLFSDVELFDAALQTFRPSLSRCPYCGAARLAPHSRYERHLVSFEGGRPRAERIVVLRFVCKSCGKTHALLPDALIPRSSFGLRFVVSVLIAYFKRDVPVAKLCCDFDIAVSTLYAWKERFRSQLPLLLGALAAAKTPALDFLKGLFASERKAASLQSFFQKHSFSFMQGFPKAATRSLSP
jgi:hypothetical protein